MPRFRFRPRLLVACSVLIAGPVSAQGPLQQANRLIAAGQPAEAVRILDSVTKASPDLPQGWGMLGAALLGARELDRAVSVLEKATSYPQARPAALYNLGLALALLGRLDQAFDRLLEAKATGRIDMTQIAFDTDAGPVNASPRVKELFPAPAEYAAPFVEPVRILREWDGERQGDQFGWIARDAGDVDGDHVHDVVTSAPTTGDNAGAVYLLSTKNGTRLWRVTGKPGDQLGTGVEAAGDVDADGIPDVIAGAPGADYVVILSGRDGRELRRIVADQPGSRFGQRVSDLGDVDGDRHADVLIGAPMHDGAGEDAGRVYVVSGRTGKNLLVIDGPAAGEQLGNALAGLRRGSQFLIAAGAPGAPGGGRTYVYKGLTATPAFVIEPDSTGAALGGMFASVVGDVDGDGVPDIYASDWANRALGPTTGRTYVHSGRTGQRLLTFTGEGPGHGFGIGVADAGDIDQDGADDLVIGAWIFPGAAPGGGKVYVYSGRSGRLLGTLTGKVMGETLGFDATGLGDVDGDGTPDLLLTSAWSAIHGARSGRVLVVSGAEVVR